MAYPSVKYSSKEIIKDKSNISLGSGTHTYSKIKNIEKNKVFMEKHNEQ
jgi:hypothetical protein